VLGAALLPGAGILVLIEDPEAHGGEILSS
jgi:hypothetical protein